MYEMRSDTELSHHMKIPDFNGYINILVRDQVSAKLLEKGIKPQF